MLPDESLYIITTSPANSAKPLFKLKLVHLMFSILMLSLSELGKTISPFMSTILFSITQLFITYARLLLLIIKDKKLYDSINYSILSEKDFSYGGKSHPTIVLPRLTGCAATVITFNKSYDDNIFINNGDANDDKYQDIGKFKYIVFCYTSEPNAIIDQSQCFYVFGLL